MYLLPIPQISDGSFSAVWTATIATKGSFCRDFQDLQDLQTFAPLRFQKLHIFGKVCKISVKFRDVHDFHWILSEFRWISSRFSRNFVGIAGNPRICPDTNKICRNLAKFHENQIKICQFRHCNYQKFGTGPILSSCTTTIFVVVQLVKIRLVLGFSRCF